MKIDDKMKRMILIVASAVVILLSMFIIFKKTNKEDELEILLEQFEKIGVDFYENFYYQQIGSTQEEVEQFLEKYNTIGIKINLDNLSRYKTEENSETIEKLIEKCNKQNTKVIIYPEEPYEQNSYKTEVATECNFEE